MHKDGGLRDVFRKYLVPAGFDFQPIESSITGAGIPDMNVCHPDCGEVWVENKRASSNGVGIDPFQVSWHERRNRRGGRTFLAVRLLTVAGPRKGSPRDELFLFPGTAIRGVFLGGLSSSAPAYHGTDGPAKWDWEAIINILKANPK